MDCGGRERPVSRWVVAWTRRLSGLFAAVVVAVSFGLGVGSAWADVPAVTVLDGGHIDFGPRFVGDEVRLQFKTHVGEVERWIDADDALLYVSDLGRIRVPVEGSQGRTWDYIAPQGSNVWWLPESAKPGLPWAGFTVDPSDRFQREYSLILDGVSGPGEVSLWEGELPFFSTRVGLPAIRPLAGHFHMSWFVTRPGVYCLALRATGRETETAASLRAAAQVTVVTAPTDPATVQPCGRTQPAPQATAVPPAVGAVGGRPTVNRDKVYELRPAVREDRLTVGLVQRSGRDPGIQRRPEDVVFYLRAAASQSASAPWQGTGAEVFQSTGHPSLNWNTLGIDADALQGDLRWQLTDVQGPGTVSVDDRVSRTIEHRAILSSTPGFAQEHYDLWPQSASTGTWSFSAPGIYCVGLRFAATTAAGTPVSEDLKLTFAVDEPTQRYANGAFTPVAATIDHATVTPCARTEAPGSRRALTVGHLDLSTRLLDGELDLAIRDDSTTPAVFRRLDGVLLRVGSNALTGVPEDPNYAFLGQAGAPVWMLPQVQNPDLLWPGWSTETLTAARVDGAVGWELTQVRGPGDFALWTDDPFDGPKVLLNSRDGLPDGFDVAQGTHAHANWGFSREGVYCLDIVQRARTAFGRAVARAETLLLAVGSRPASAVTEADCPAPSPPEPTEPVVEPTSPATPIVAPPISATPTPADKRPPVVRRLRVGLVLDARRVRRTSRLRATVTLSAGHAAGRVVVRDGRRVLAGVKVGRSARRVRLRLTHLRPGARRLVAEFRAANGRRTVSRSAALTVRP